MSRPKRAFDLEALSLWTLFVALSLVAFVFLVAPSIVVLLTSFTSSASLTSHSSTVWKLPSPTWPTIVDTSRVSRRSRWVSVTHSASREIGTQTSVVTGSAPGRRPRDAQ